MHGRGSLSGFPIMNDDAAVFLAADEARRDGADLIPPGVMLLVENQTVAGDAFGKGLLHDGAES